MDIINYPHHRLPYDVLRAIPCYSEKLKAHKKPSIHETTIDFQFKNCQKRPIYIPLRGKRKSAEFKTKFFSVHHVLGGKVHSF